MDFASMDDGSVRVDAELAAALEAEVARAALEPVRYPPSYVVQCEVSGGCRRMRGHPGDCLVFDEGSVRTLPAVGVDVGREGDG